MAVAAPDSSARRRHWLSLGLPPLVIFGLGLLILSQIAPRSAVYPAPENPEDWFKYDFAELKTVCEQFLTVVVGVLVLSITFSEKVVPLDTAGREQKWFLKAAWYCCFLALVAGGIGMALIMMAGAFVRYPGTGDYRAAQTYSLLMLIGGGLTFTLGLIYLVVSATWPDELKAPAPAGRKAEASAGPSADTDQSAESHDELAHPAR